MFTGFLMIHFLLFSTCILVGSDVSDLPVQRAELCQQKKQNRDTSIAKIDKKLADIKLSMLYAMPDNYNLKIGDNPHAKLSKIRGALTLVVRGDVMRKASESHMQLADHDIIWTQHLAYFDNEVALYSVSGSYSYPRDNQYDGSYCYSERAHIGISLPVFHEMNKRIKQENDPSCLIL